MPIVTGMSENMYPSLAYEDAPAAIEWLGKAFGLRPDLVIPGEPGTIAHAELRTPHGAVVMVISTQLSTRRNRSPRSLGGTAQSIYLVVDDVDARHERAVAAGAEVFNPLHDTEYGSREFCCFDPEGHIWTFGSYQPAVGPSALVEPAAQS